MFRHQDQQNGHWFYCCFNEQRFWQLYHTLVIQGTDVPVGHVGLLLDDGEAVVDDVDLLLDLDDLLALVVWQVQLTSQLQSLTLPRLEDSCFRKYISFSN